MDLEGRYRAFIYIQVTYAAYAAHAMSKVSKISKVSTKTHTGYFGTW